MTRWMPLLLVALLAVGLVAAACGDENDSGADTANGDASPTASAIGQVDGANDEEVVAGEVDRDITVQGLAELRFQPSEITVKIGERVRVTFENADETTLHDFTILDMHAEEVHTEGSAEHEMEDMDEGAPDDGAVHVAAEPGEHGSVTFTATEPGEYEFICTVDAHAEAGMVGTLIVEQ